jgi:hypothetical protein
MKQSKKVIFGMMGLLLGSSLIGGCGSSRSDYSREYQHSIAGNSIGGKQPSIQAATANPAVVDEYACEGDKVLICHVSQGNPGNAHELCIDRSALEDHLGCQQGGGGGHGDHLGSCDQDPNPAPTLPAVDPS